MKLILLKDVKSLGKKGDVVEVNEGYGRNFIIPSKAGVLADAKNLNSLKLQKKKEEKLAAEKLAHEAATTRAAAEEKRMRMRLITSLVFCIPLFYLAMGHMMGITSPQFFLCVPSM